LREGGAPDDVAATLEQGCQEADLDFVRAEVPTALSQSKEGIERVATIVRAMKAFGRPDPSEPEPMDINRVVTYALTMARNELKYVAEVTTDLGPLPTVSCFPGAIGQVVINLVVNAAYAVGESRDRTGERGGDQGEDVVGRGPGGPKRERHRAWHTAGRPPPHIPAFLHDQALWARERPGAGHGLGDGR
jgi:signal transduction histidine kinase